MDQPSDSSSRSEEQYLKYKRRAVIIGWLGEFISSLTLVLAGLALQFSDDLVLLLLELMRHGTDNYNQVMHGVLLVGSSVYALSLANILICALLLIGIARRCTALVFPWLFYHGLLFGITLYLAIYVIVSGVLVPINIFLMTSALFSVGLVLFFRILNDILMLFKWMHAMDEIQATSYRLERSAEGNESSESSEFCVICTF